MFNVPCELTLDKNMWLQNTNLPCQQALKHKCSEISEDSSKKRVKVGDQVFVDCTETNETETQNYIPLEISNSNYYIPVDDNPLPQINIELIDNSTEIEQASNATTVVFVEESQLSKKKKQVKLKRNELVNENPQAGHKFCNITFSVRYFCPACDEFTLLNKDMLCHFRNIHKDINYSTLVRYLKNKPKPFWNCSLSSCLAKNNSMFSSESQFRNHVFVCHHVQEECETMGCMKLQGLVKYICPLCDLSYKHDKRFILSHIESEHKNVKNPDLQALCGTIKPKDDAIWACSKCFQNSKYIYFENIHTLFIHISMKHLEENDVCQKQNKSQKGDDIDTVIKGEKVVQLVSTCVICSKTFHDQDELLLHTKSEHTENSDASSQAVTERKEMWTCNLCTKMTYFPDEKQLDEHIKQQHSSFQNFKIEEADNTLLFKSTKVKPTAKSENKIPKKVPKKANPPVQKEETTEKTTEETKEFPSEIKYLVHQPKSLKERKMTVGEEKILAGYGSKITKRMHVCSRCKENFHCKDNVLQHIATVHGDLLKKSCVEQIWSKCYVFWCCNLCPKDNELGAVFKSFFLLQKHVFEEHDLKQKENCLTEVVSNRAIGLPANTIENNTVTLNNKTDIPVEIKNDESTYPQDYQNQVLFTTELVFQNESENKNNSSEILKLGNVECKNVCSYSNTAISSSLSTDVTLGNKQSNIEENFSCDMSIISEPQLETISLENTSAILGFNAAIPDVQNIPSFTLVNSSQDYNNYTETQFLSTPQNYQLLNTCNQNSDQNSTNLIFNSVLDDPAPQYSILLIDGQHVLIQNPVSISDNLNLTFQDLQSLLLPTDDVAK